MKRSLTAVFAAAAISVAFYAPAPARGQDLGLVKELAGLGVTTSQASGGLLAIMQLAQTNLGPSDFGKLMGMVPEIGDFMGAAGGAAAAAGAMGAARAAGGETDKAHAADDAAYAAEHEAHAAEHEAHAAEHEADAAAPAKPAAAPMAGAAGAMGGAASGMPQITGLSELAAVPSLVSAFSGMGLGPEMIQQFVPIILKYVMGSGGSAAGQLLATGLGLGLM